MAAMPDRPWSSFFLTATSRGSSLRVGIALDGDLTLTRAQASIVDDIRTSDFANVVLVVIADPRRLTRFRGWGWRLYSAIDRHRVRVENDPDTREPLGTSLPGVDVVRVDRALSGSNVGQLDVILDFSREGLDGALLGAARYGAWAFRTSISLRDHLLWVTLIRRPSADAAPLLVAGGVFANDPLALGPSRARASFGSTHLAIQQLRELQRRGWSSFDDQAEGIPTQDVPERSEQWPSSWEIARWIGPIVAGRIVDKVRRLTTRRDDLQHWRIALRVRRKNLEMDSPVDMSGFRWVESPPGHLYADPFLVERNDRTWLFFEDYSYADRRGVIASAEVSSEGQIGEQTVVIASAGHLSYPYVFLDRGEAYLIPESSMEGVVRLYRARNFPYEWEPVTELFRGPAVDTSVWEQDDRWWFFTTLCEPRGGASMLMLFSSDMLSGPWESHPMNPISLDVRRSRGAGRIFRQDGRLVRPSQDCSRTYGYSFSLNEIVTLTRTDYVERRLSTVPPDWAHGLTATHTYSRAGYLEATDGRINRASRLVL